MRTPRGSFQVTAMSREQMEAAGYGVHHISDDGKYLIMGNGTRAFAVAAEQPEKDNPLRTAEMTLEDDYGMIDGVINNGRRGEELGKAQEYAERITPEKPSIRERLENAKRECAEHKPQEGKKPGRVWSLARITVPNGLKSVRIRGRKTQNNSLYSYFQREPL